MSLPLPKPTKREAQFLKEHHEYMTVKEMAKLLCRGHEVVRGWMKELNLSYKIPAKPNAKPRSKVLAWDKGKQLQDIWR